MNQKAIIDMISYYKNEHWAAHTLKVFGYAQGIAAGEGITGKEKEIIEYAALFHDVGIPAGLRECGSSAGPIQERLGWPIAMEMAKKYVDDEKMVERIGWLVGHHHSFGIKGERDLQILFEADWLVNLVEGDDLDKAQETYDKIFVTETGKLFMRELLLK